MVYTCLIRSLKISFALKTSAVFFILNCFQDVLEGLHMLLRDFWELKTKHLWLFLKKNGKELLQGESVFDETYESFNLKKNIWEIKNTRTFYVVIKGNII